MDDRTDEELDGWMGLMKSWMHDGWMVGWMEGWG